VRRRKTGKEKRTEKGNRWWSVEKKMKGIEKDLGIRVQLFLE